MHISRGIVALATTVLAAAATVTGLAPAASATDPFYQYSGSAPLSAIAPGTILKSRTLPYHIVGVPVPVTAVQMLYRTTDAQQRPRANVTSVLIPPGGGDPSKAISYQSAYDSLNPEHSPSRAMAGDVSFGGAINSSESGALAPFLAQGYSVIVTDTEGQTADFAAGPEYGTNTLDGLRAATRSPATHLGPRTRIALYGYSGGAIATNWAAALAPKYAPDINRQLVGAAEGGILADPAHNLRYADGSGGWAGVVAMAIIGIARSYGIDFDTYLNDFGRHIVATLSDASIGNVLFQYPGLTWRQMTKPQFADPNSVPPFVDVVRKIDMGLAPTPTIPLFMGQGANGTIEGSDNGKPGIGPGDGVMIAGDVRSLARQYCATGDPAIVYRQYDVLSHIGSVTPWAAEALLWLNDRFAGRPAPSTCGGIAPGNPLTPQL